MLFLNDFLCVSVSFKNPTYLSDGGVSICVTLALRVFIERSNCDIKTAPVYA